MSERPAPEEWLRRAAAEEARRQRGRLRIFLGAAPGVGKTYAMLSAARQRQAEGLDLAIGWLEAHGRAETDALAEGLPRVEPREVEHRSLRLADLDLDAALARRPALLLVDELAHTNAPGCRHRQRWQDVEELLAAGIDVWTTLNVQHLESSNDLVLQVTGVRVQETVPDAIFDRADEIEVVDLAPEDLLRRLGEGRIYAGAAAARAAAGFFRQGNLIALRELALRKGTERVDAQVEDWRRDHGIAAAWGTGERLLVAVGPAPQAANLVRATYRMANRLRAPWIAATVEPAVAPSPADAARLSATLALAARLGAEVLILPTASVPDALVGLAQRRAVTRIVVGRPTHPRWRDRLAGSLVEELIRRADGIDVIVTTGEPAGAPPAGPLAPPAAPLRPPRLRELAEAVAGLGLACLLGLALREAVTVTDLAMLLLVPVIASASRHGRGPALAIALASVAAFNFLFVEPYYTFEVSDHRYLITFVVMLAVAGTVVRLTGRLRRAAAQAAARERRTAALYDITQALVALTDPAEIGAVVVDQVQGLLGCGAVLFLKGPLRPIAGAAHPLAADPRELGVAAWVVDQGKPAGFGTDTLPGGLALHLPLMGAEGPIGVLAVALRERPAEAPPLSPAQRLLIETFGRKASLAIERSQLAAQAADARQAASQERLKNDLLSAVSHDLRTPLASITGSAALLRAQPNLPLADREGLAATIEAEGARLGRLVADLLDLTRIESGAVQARREWYPAEELVAAALGRLAPLLTGRAVTVRLPPAMLLLFVDPTLFEQVLQNLVENAARHTPAGVPIEIAGDRDPAGAWLEVRDRGPGLPPGEEERVFEKFYQAGDGARGGGTGLGLAICRAILAAHQGRLVAANRPEGGAVLRLTLPQGEPPPESP